MTVLRGDLAAHHFGLTDNVWEELCGRIAHIYHSGTRVDVTLPYATLRAANVGGTLTAIDLALSSGACLHYVSSASALSASPDEGWLQLKPQELSGKSGYGATKAVSELLLQQAARSCGLVVRLFRLSAICGDELSHAWNPHDFSYLLLSAALAVKALPQPARCRLHWVPVRWAARAIVALAGSPETRNRAFHLVGDGPSLDECVAAMAAQGTHLRRCTQAEWRDDAATRLLSALPSQHQAQPLLAEIRALDFAASNAHHIPTSSTKAALQRLGIAWFDITEALLQSCAASIVQNSSAAAAGGGGSGGIVI